MNHHLDDHLRDALRREEPPAGFADRILDRLPATRPVVIELPVRRRLAPRFALAAAAALVAVAAASAWLAMPHGAIQPSPPQIAEAAPPQTIAAPPVVVRPPEATQLPSQKPPAPPVQNVRVRWTRRPAPQPRTDDAEGQRAAEQLRLALQITGDKLNVARHEVHEALTVPES